MKFQTTTLVMFHSDYQYEETHIITDVNSIEFHTEGKVEVSEGWKELFYDAEEIERKNISLSPVKEMSCIGVGTYHNLPGGE